MFTDKICNRIFAVFLLCCSLALFACVNADDADTLFKYSKGKKQLVSNLELFHGSHPECSPALTDPDSLLYIGWFYRVKSLDGRSHGALFVNETLNPFFDTITGPDLCTASIRQAMESDVKLYFRTAKQTSRFSTISELLLVGGATLGLFGLFSTWDGPVDVKSNPLMIGSGICLVGGAVTYPLFVVSAVKEFRVLGRLTNEGHQLIGLSNIRFIRSRCSGIR